MRTLFSSVVFAIFVAATIAPSSAVAAEEYNACGCYRDAKGNCGCIKSKKLKCDCPGDCEPVGCEAQRAKQAEKEADAALKRIAAKEKKKQDEALKAQSDKKKTKDKPIKK